MGQPGRPDGGWLHNALVGLLTGEMVGQQDALGTRILQTEINRLRYPAEEAVGRIEWILQSQRADGIDDIGAAEWRPPDWSATDEQEKGQYVAIVRRDGKIVRHSNAARQDRQLTEDWYSRVVAEGGEGVMEPYNNAGGTTFRVSLNAMSPANGRVTRQ